MGHLDTTSAYANFAEKRAATIADLERPYLATSSEPRRRQFAVMQGAFSPHFGMASADEIVALMRPRTAQPLSTLARWIATRKIVSFSWQAQTLVPLFQFELTLMAPRIEALQIVDELACVFNDWELALWFAQPNVWLDDMAPVELLLTDEGAVLQAARADRFIARG